MASRQDHRNIGIKVTPPAATCKDKNCAFHGEIKVRGKTFEATVVKTLMQKTAVVTWERKRFVPKFERYEKAMTKLKVHNPTCINAVKGEKVMIAETRPLSKTKHFVIIQKVGQDFAFQQKEESKDEAAQKKKKIQSEDTE